jgi:hypothetical protein
MFKQTIMLIGVGCLLASCTGYVPREWRPETVEERGLRWAVKLCRSFGIEEETPEMIKCVSDRYDRFLMDNK